MTSRAELNTAVEAERTRRLRELRAAPATFLRSLPALMESEVEVLGRSIVFTTYAEPRNDGRLLILVRSDDQRLLGMVSYGAANGFWLMPDGTLAEVSEQDIR